jgi:trigger factor
MELRSSNKIDTNRWELEIAVPPEDFNKEVDKIYNRQKGKITVPGFRKGKAPRSFIEKYYGSQIFYEDAVNAIYPYAIDDAAKQAGIELVDDHIDFEVVKLSKEDGLVFKVKVTVMPDVTVENYKGMEVKKKKVEKVTEDDINKEIEALRERNARLVTADDGAAEMGDNVNIDFEGYVDSKLFDGGSAKDVALELGKKQFIEGFEEQVAGHKVGDEFEVKVKFPEDYHVTTLAGKEAIFKTKLNKIQKKELPQVDDEFAKDISEFDTLEEFKKDLKNKLSEDRKAKSENEIENETIEKFIELVKADIPDALVKAKVKELVNDFESRLKPQGLNLKDYLKYTGETIESLEEKFLPQATDHVKLDLGLKKVGELESIKASEEEIEKEYEKVADYYRMKAEQVKKFIRKEDLEKSIIKTKALEILKNNRIEK